jgi:hypothetical protein
MATDPLSLLASVGGWGSPLVPPTPGGPFSDRKGLGQLFTAGLPMTRIAQNIELYNLAYRLAWKNISELQKRVHPNIAFSLHDSIRRQLKQRGAKRCRETDWPN